MFVKFVLLQGAQLGWNEIFKESLPPGGNRLSTNNLEDKKREKIPALGWTQTHDLSIILIIFKRSISRFPTNSAA